MDQDRWLRVKEIFHAALDAAPADRVAVVQAACGGDLAIADEVEELLRADAADKSYLDAPFVPVGSLRHAAMAGDVLSPDDVLCGRFRIVRKVAEGGMGQVFEAFDQEIGVRVALKTIRAGIAERPEAMARFRQEVRLARRVTHPNVCRTFDLGRDLRSANGEQVELVFLTMEFLEGEPLSELLRRQEPIATDAALSIAGQVAAALDAAHALGVIHRDMKPANVMLVRGPADTGAAPRAVVTDFGLARLDPLMPAAEASPLTHSGNAMGTLSYMAPEQLEGTASSPATDIYAFGLILYEMATGVQAFPASHLLSGIAQRLRGSVPLETLQEKNVSARWRSAIEACLRVNPKERPASGADVVRLLQDGPSTAMLGRAAWRRARPWFTRAWGVATMSIVGMSLFLLCLRLYQKEDDPKLKAGALVYLANVKNETPEKPLDGMTELLRAGLAQSSQVTLLDTGRAGDILQQMARPADTPVDAATAREIAMRAGAARVVFATVSGGNKRYRLDIDVQQPDATPYRYRRHWSKSFTWAGTANEVASTEIAPELLMQIREASDWIRQEVGESANDIATLDTPPEEATTGNWQALSEYSRAESLLRGGSRTEAVTLLQHAVELDPHFSLANARLADVLISLDRGEEGFKAYEQALSPENAQRLTRYELDRIRGIYAGDTWDYATAEEQFRDLSVYYEHNYLGYFYRAEALVFLDRVKEAKDTIQRAFTLHSDGLAVPSAMATYALMARDRALSQIALSQMRKNGQLLEAELFAAQVEFIDGKLKAAEDRVSRQLSFAHGIDRLKTLQLLAHLQSEGGQDSAAVATLGEMISAAEAAGNKAYQSLGRSDRAAVECRLAKYAECASDAVQAEALDRGPKTSMAASLAIGSSIANAPPAEAAQLRKTLVEIERSAPHGNGRIFEVAAARTRGEVLLSQQQCTGALREFRLASQQDAPSTPREYLARALSQCAAHEIDARQAALWKSQADDAYERGAFAQDRLLWQLEWYPPGFFSQQLDAWIKVESGRSNRKPRFVEAQRYLAEIRADAVLSGASQAHEQ